MALWPQRFGCWGCEILQNVFLEVDSIRKVFLDLCVRCIVIDVAFWCSDDVFEAICCIRLDAEGIKLNQAFLFDLLLERQ
jgi:hypothetical protein